MQDGRAQHFVPRATVLGFLLQPDRRTDTTWARRRPPLLPPCAGSRPNSTLGPASVNLARLPRYRLGSAAVGMLRWGAGWDHGAEGRDVGGQSGFALAPTGLEHPMGLEHPPDLSRGAGQVSPPRACRAGVAQVSPPRRGRAGVALGMRMWPPAPCSRPTMPQHGGSSQPVLQAALQTQGQARPAPSESCDSAAR